MNISYRYIYYSAVALILVIGVSCSTSKNSIRRKKSNNSAADTTQMAQKNLSDLQKMLQDTRSRLSDVYATQRQEVPDAFRKKSSSDESINSDPFDGYRIQIISTKNVQLADSVASQFRAWADTTIGGYSAKTYVFFKQPFYKVHVGDFHKRKKADDFTQMVKRNYPEAWVVHDRIDPSNVPSDTTSFSILKPGERRKRKAETDSLKTHIQDNQ